MNLLETIQFLESNPPFTPKIVQLITKTKPTLLKKHPYTKEPIPFQNVTRLSQRRGFVGVNYQNVVNNQRIRENKIPNFSPNSLWNNKGTHFSPLLVQHIDTKKLYLPLFPQGISQDKWMNNDQEISHSELIPYFPKKSKSNTQDTDKEIYWRIFDLDSIISIKYGSIQNDY